MSTKKQLSDASAPLADPWFIDEESGPSLRPSQPPPRTRKERTTMAPLPKEK